MRRGNRYDVPPQPLNPPSGNQVPVVPSSLLDSVDPVAIGISRSAYNRNCRTGRGIWELSPRHRRFKSNPSRTYTETGVSCTTYSSDDATIAQSGSGTSWSDLDYVKALDPQYATCAFAIGTTVLSNYIDLTNLLPSSTLVGTIDSVSLKVSAKIVGDLGVTETTVQPKLSGSSLGSNLATSRSITTTESEATFALSTLPSVAQANAGSFGLSLRYTQETWPSEWSVPSNYTVVVTNSGSATMTVTVTYIGPGAKPPRAYVNIISQAVGQIDASAFAVPYEVYGTATANNGQGTIDSGTVHRVEDYLTSSSSSRTAYSIVKTSIALTAGVGSVNVARSVTGSITSSTSGVIDPIIAASYSGSASFVAPTPSTVYVNSALARFCVSGTESIKTGAQGIGYGEFETNREVSTVWGQSEFKCPIADAAGNLTSTWTGPNYAGLLDADSWFIWQYGKWLWYANPDEGVYFREIGTTAFTSLSRDYSFQGNASLSTTYATTRTWDAVTNTITITDNAPVIDWASTAIVDGAAELTGTTDDNGTDGEFTFQSTWATAENWNHSAHFEIELLCGTGASEFYLDNSKIEINWESAPATYTWEEIETKQFKSGSHEAGNAKKTLIGRLKDLVTRGDDINVKGVRFTTTSFIDQNNSAAVFATINPIRFGGAHLGADASADRLWDSGVTGTEIEYACRYKKISTSEVSGADVAKATASLSIGAKWQSYSTYRGGRTEIRSASVNQAPFLEDTGGSPDIVIEFMRKDATGKWRSLGTKGNTSTQSFYDDYEEWEMSTLSEVTDFSTDVDSGIFGEVTGIICGCAWKGSNVYAHENGKVYFSASNDAKNVLWDGVVETNEVILGSPKTAARTDVLADNTVDPAISLVASENLYALTAREVYVFVSDDGTPATASFPRKIESAMGVVGTRAACQWKGAALYATLDGLTVIKKSSASGEQPDYIDVLTKDLRETWQWLLGDSPSTVIVRAHLMDIWVLNETRAIWFREGEHFIPIEWADSRSAVDACVSPDYGVLVQWSNGHVSRMQDVATDGASDSVGATGLPVIWEYSSGEAENESAVSRVTVVTEGSGSVTLVSDTGEQEIVAESATEDALRIPVEHNAQLTRLNRSRLSVNVSGTGDAKVKSLFLILATRSRSRTPSY